MSGLLTDVGYHPLPPDPDEYDNPDPRDVAVNDEQASSERPETEGQSDRVVVTYNKSYLKSRAGAFWTLECTLSLAALVCIVSSGSEYGSYLYLPLVWHYRVFIFIVVAGILTSLILVVGHATSITKMFTLNWTIVEMILNAVLTFMYLFGASLIASAEDFYVKTKKIISEDTHHKLIAATVFGYVTMALFAVSTLLQGMQWRTQKKEPTVQRKLSQSEESLVV